MTSSQISIIDLSATVMASTSASNAALAGVAGLFLHKALDVAADKIAVGFFVAALQVRDDAFVGRIKLRPSPELTR
jgi:hypothetical protein